MKWGSGAIVGLYALAYLEFTALAMYDSYKRYGHPTQQEQAQALIVKRYKVKIKEIKGIEPYPSETNFILFKIDRDSKEVFDRLSDNGILVRNFGNDDYLKNCLRVTIGTSEENDEFLDEIKKIIT